MAGKREEWNEDLEMDGVILCFETGDKVPEDAIHIYSVHEEIHEPMLGGFKKKITGSKHYYLCDQDTVNMLIDKQEYDQYLEKN